MRRKIADYQIMVQIYHEDPKHTLESLNRLSPDYMADPDEFDPAGFEMLKAAMAESGNTIIK